MDKSVEQYQAWVGGLTLPTWTDMQGWKEGHCTMTEIPRTSVPPWFREMLRGKKRLADIERLPLVGG